MKKIVSALVSLALIAASIVTPLSVSAETAGKVVTTNTYDESGVSYQSFNGRLEEKIDDDNAVKNIDGYTIRTYKNNELRIANYDAVIRQESTGNYAAMFGEHNNGNLNYGFPNTLWIYDSNDANYGLFTPKTNTSYTLNFRYRSDGTDYGKAIFLSIARKSSANSNVYNDDLAYIKKLVTISSKSSDWATVSATFKTGAVVSPLYICMHSANDWWNSDTKLWVDDIQLIEGEAVAPAGDTMVNTYDDPGVTYVKTGTFSTSTSCDAGTDRVYNSTTFTNFSLWGAQIDATTGVDGKTTNAAHFGCHQNGEKAVSGSVPWPWNNTVRIYDANSNDLDMFTPKANSEYRISFNYRSDSNFSDTKSVKFSLIAAPSAAGYTYSPDFLLVNELVKIGGKTDGWQTVESSFVTGDTVTPLLLIMRTAANQWWASDVDVWIDNIAITYVKTNEPTEPEEPEEEKTIDPGAFMYVPMIDEDFSDTALNALPTGWSRDFPYTFLWAGNAATGLNNSTVGVKSDATGKYLQYYSTSGGHIITLPEISSENYRFTAKVRFNSLTAGTFGLVTDIYSNPADTKNVTIAGVISKADDGKEISLFNRAWYIKDYQGNNNGLKEYPLSTAFPNGVAVDTEIDLTVYHYDDCTYYYIDDTFIGSINDYTGGKRSRVGLYNSYGSDVKIYSVRVDALYDATDISEALYPCKNILFENFSDVAVGSLPNGWIRNYAHTFLWAGNNATGLNNSTVGVKSENGKKYLEYNSANGAHIITLPAVGVADYVFTTTFKFLSATTGTFGLVTGIADNYTAATGATIATVRSTDDGDAEITLFNRKNSSANYNGSSVNEQTFKAEDFFDGSLPPVGEEITATVYHYNRTNYYFINGKLVGSVADITDGTRVGFYNSYGANVAITSVSVNQLGAAQQISTLHTDCASVRYATAQGLVTKNAGGLKVKASFEKSEPVYTKALANGNTVSIGMLVAEKDSLGGNPLTAFSDSALNIENVEMNDLGSKISFELKLLNLNAAELNARYVIRPYLKITGNGEDTYYYAKPSQYCPARLANKVYREGSADMKQKVKTLFASADEFLGDNAPTLKFALFSDLHYNVGQYMSTVADLETILKRGYDNNVDFALHCGDFCNNYKGSPELTNAYLNNKYSMPVYGVYGNHELEGANNSVDYVTTKLTNQNVVWGTEDGKISPDGSIAYYYSDTNGFRLIGIDTNYSYNPTLKIWEHNKTCSYGPPNGNTNINALGPEQLSWLESVLLDAAAKKIPCIISCHAPMHSDFADASSDAGVVSALYERVNEIREGTVIAEISGHAHLDRTQVKNNIIYFNVNTVRNGHWEITNTPHYTTESFIQVTYDDAGNPTNGQGSPATFASLIQGNNSWFFADPLSCIVTVSAAGEFVIEGMESEWIYGIAPSDSTNPAIGPYRHPAITSASFDLAYNN